MPSIEIDQALAGSHISSNFTAIGTFSGNVADITCSIMKGTVTKASGAVSSHAPGNWQAVFTALAPDSGLSLVAHITGSPSDEDEQPNITVDAAEPIILNPLPNPEQGPSERVMVTVTGKHRQDVIAIICAVCIFNRKELQEVVAVWLGEVNTPKRGQWQSKPKFKPVPKGKKFGILAIGFNKHGEIVGQAFRRRK